MASQVVEQAIVTAQAAKKVGQETTKLALFNADGTPYKPANKDKAEIAALATVTQANATPSVAAPTKAEFDAVVALANDLKTKLNAVINALKA